MAHDVFISYSSQDKPIADAVCATLESKGIRCWIAPRDIVAGMSYAKAITQALNGSRLLVLVFSAHANDSDDVAKEVERACSKGLTVVPFRIEDVPMSDELEYHLSSTHWLDALTPPLEQHLAHLADTVGLLLERMTGMPAQSVGPRAPVAHEGQGTDLTSWAGHIVQWSEDPKEQKTAWYVTADLQRLWIPDAATYDRLKAMGAPGPVALPGSVLDRLPDQIGHWAAAGDRMSINRTLRRGMSLTSADERYRLGLGSDGALVLSGPSGQPLFTNDRVDTAFVVFQDDGDLVCRRGDGTITWASGTGGTGATQLVVQNDGNAAISASSGEPIWSTGEGRIAAPMETATFAIELGTIGGYHYAFTAGLDVTGPSGRFPVVVGCSLRRLDGLIVDHPARRLLSPGRALFGVQVLDQGDPSDPWCQVFGRPGDGHEPVVRGDVIFACYRDSGFSERLCDTGWRPFEVRWLMGCDPSALDTRDSELAQWIGRERLGKRVWQSLDGVPIAVDGRPLL